MLLDSARTMGFWSVAGEEIWMRGALPVGYYLGNRGVQRAERHTQRVNLFQLGWSKHVLSLEGF